LKRILMLLSNAFDPDPRVHREALSFLEAGYAVKILCWDRGEGLPEKEAIDGIEVERITLRSAHGRGTAQIFFLGMLWARMFVRALGSDADIAYCHDFDTLPVGIALKLVKRKKAIFDSHEVYSRMLGRNVSGVVKGITVFLERLLIRRADHVVVTCPAMRDLYLAMGVSGISVAGNYKDPDDYKVPCEALANERANLGIGNKLVISYISNLGPERIIEPLLETVKEDGDIFLIVGGEGYKRKTVEDASKECARIKYLGYVPPDKVPLYTALSDIVYYGYDRKAGMAEFCNPNKLFEALASGKAFIGGDFGQMGEIIREERCGLALEEFTVETVKKAVDTMKDPAKLRMFKDNALRAGREKYRWRISEKSLLAAVAGVIAE
jgi:glycosyltransferase involved in cell wall biosynthesis